MPQGFFCVVSPHPNIRARYVPATLALIVQKEKLRSTPCRFLYTVALNRSGLTVSGERMADKTAAEQLERSLVRGSCHNQKGGAQGKVRKAACPLYDLDYLQRDANRLLGFYSPADPGLSAKLEEKKLCTYPRTDSHYLTGDMADKACRAL